MPLTQRTSVRPTQGGVLLRAMGIAAAVGLAVGLYVGISSLL